MATCAFAIVRKIDKILLVQIAPPFTESYKWNFPGGVIEAGEAIRLGLAREVFEETGVSCSIDAVRDEFSTTEPDNNITIFDANYIKGDLSIQESELLGARWFTIPEALELPLAFNIRAYLVKIGLSLVS